MKFKSSFKNHSIFFFLLVFTLVVLSIIIYISIISPTKEEFVELYWQVFRVRDLNYTDDVTCKIFICSKSGIYKIGNIDINDEKFGIILTDLERDEEYNFLCIDFNNDDVYCDGGEGPFRERETFLIDSNAYSILNLKENNIVIAHYPKDVYDQNFNVGFVAKSHYSHTEDFEINLFVNESIENSMIFNLKPKEETFSKFKVTLPSEGLFKVKVSVTSPKIDEKVNIDFWVNYKT